MANMGCETKACVVCDKGSDEAMAEVAGKITHRGFAVLFTTSVETGTTMAYTVGLTETCCAPEVVMICDDATVARTTTRVVANRLVKDPYAAEEKELTGCVFRDGNLVPLGCRTVSDENAKSHLSALVDRYGDRTGFKVKQLVMPDANGYLPWDPKCNAEFVKKSAALY